MQAPEFLSGRWKRKGPAGKPAQALDLWIASALRERYGAPAEPMSADLTDELNAALAR